MHLCFDSGSEMSGYIPPLESTKSNHAQTDSHSGYIIASS